ncbi:MAG TPA: choice-of-anchor Q domain-containing protein, partial [Pyrinomonadaceae bacterium]|nr:choice-of-anchor Q domain-containing protein [Pyrinomonadaceae bacterium]
MKSQLSLYLCRRNLHVFIACLLTFAIITTPFIPIATAMSPGERDASAVADHNSVPPNATAQQSVNLYAAVPAPAPAPFVVPAITATKTDALVVDGDGDTVADPGDTIEYTIQINNGGGATDANDVVFNDTIDAHTTLVGGSVSSQPIALNDTYSASGNIQISLAAPGVLTNDRDPDTGNNSGLTVTKVQGAGANVGVATDTTATGRGGVKGKVTLSSNGSFTYEPPPGFTGSPGVDTFTYEISDGTKTDTATVTINITQMVWFISNNAGGLNLGTFSNPFTSIASFNTANAGSGAVPDPKNGDFISLRLGTGTYTETDGVNLRAQQKLIGNAVQFNTVFTADANSSSAYTTFASGTTAAPNIVTTGGNGVDLSTDNTVRGLNVGNTPGFFKINGTAVGSPIINNVNLTGTGGALKVTISGAFGSNVSFGTLESTSSAETNLNLAGVTGTLGIASGGTGLSGSAVAFSAVNVSGGSVSFTYPGNVTKSNNGSLVSIIGGHSGGTITFSGTLSASAGTGFQFDNADGTYNFNGTNTLNGGDAGIDILNGSGGTFNFSASSTITSPTGTAFNVASSPGNPTVTYSGSITDNTAGQRTVNIDGTTGGSISINSVTAASTAGGVSNTGVNINNASGSVTFTTLNLGTSGNRMTAQAVTIAGGSGAKNLGTASIFTTGTAEGIHSTTTTGAITTTTGEVNSAGAAAINIAGTSSATRTPLNVQLTSLSANGGAKGLIILNTSATGSPGGFRVNGTGTTDGSGGTIQNTTTRGADIQTAESILLKNMNFTNANSSVDGGSAGACDDLTISGCNGAIYLNGVTTLATFDNLNLTGTMVENGVTALNVANFKFDNSLVDGAGNEVHESGIEAQNLSGIATVNNTEIRFSETDAFAVTNTDTSVNLAITSSTFRDSQTQFSGGPVNTNGEGGLQFRSFSVAAGQPTATINVTNSSFLRLRTQSIQVFAQDDTIINLDITGSTLDSQTDIGTGIDINTDDTATMNFNILNNPTIQSRGGAAVNITSFLDSHMEGRVNNNADIEVLGGPGIPVRLVAQETSDMIVEINGNTVSNVNGTEDTAIDVQSRFQTARVDATITNNNVTVENTGIADINLISGSSTAGESVVTCGDVANNTAHGNGAARAFRVRISDLSNTNRLFLEGFVEAGTATQDTEATWTSRGNTPGAAEVIASLTATAVGPLAPPGGVCLAVDTPGDFSISSSLASNSTDAGSVAPPTQPAAAPATSAVSSDVIASQPANSTQPSMLARAMDGLARFATAVHSLVEPTAYASSNTSIADSAQPVSTAVQTAQLRTENSTASSLRTQKTEVKGVKKVLSNHARSTRVLPMIFSGETVNVNIGTLAPGDSVTITFRVTVNNPPNLTLLNPARVSNQGTVSGSNFSNVLTDDTAAGGAADPTDTPIDLFNTSTNLVSDLNPSNFGDLVTFTATVSETPVQGSVDPTGTVDFIDTSNGNAVVCNDVALSAGSAQCQTSTLTSGTHNIRADYSGDGNFDSSQSNIVAQVVNACTPNPIVTSNADSGAGTLREALANVCAGTTITFNIAGAGPHTITLTTGELAVAKNVTINNNSGESITISGNNAGRVFNINSGKTAAIIGLTLTGGSATDGGAIVNDGSLTVVNSTLTGNAATNDGGAISTTATGTSLTLINTTISGNTAAGSGGGVIVLGGTATSINSTITNNVADSDNNSAGDGGGIRAQAGTTTLKNTIVAGNFNEDGTTDAADDISGTVDAASSFNLIGTGGAGGLTDGVNNNQVGVATPGIGPLANNGGTTFTHALLSTSPAVETGGNANLPADTFDLDGDANTAETLPVDQRGVGFPRTADSADANVIQTVDIGAFELHPSIEDIANQTTNEDTVKNVTFNLGDDTGSLIATVAATSSNTTLVPNANLIISGSGGSRNLQITPAANESGTTTITVTVTATNGRTATDTFDLTVNATNDPPSGTDNTVSTAEDTAYTFTAADFGFTDPNDTPPNTFLAVKITTLPGLGTLTNNNVPVNAGDFISVADINAGLLKFTPALDGNGTPYTSFTFQVQDAGGGTDLDPTPNTMTINVTAVNDGPVNTVPGPQSTTEDTPKVFSSGNANQISVADVDAGSNPIKITLTATNGTLTLSTTAGLSFITGDGTADATMMFTGTLTAVNTALNGMSFNPTTDFNGAASLQIVSDDQGNTGTGGPLTDTDTVNITVNAANDAPVVTTTAGNLSYTENDPATAIDPGLTVTDGDSANLVGATVAITSGFVSGQDTLAFTTQLGITGNYNSGTGVLTLTGSSSVANYQTALRSVTYQNSSDNPTASRTVTFIADDGSSTSAPATRGITINAVNDAPVNT